MLISYFRAMAFYQEAVSTHWGYYPDVGLTVGRENPRASWAFKLMGQDFRTRYGLS